MHGKMVTSNKLRIGFFAQHQVDELRSTKRRWITCSANAPTKARPNCARVLPDLALAPTRPIQLSGGLSGGQKARLSLLLATLPAPHLLILDEPTNHLDIESREALVEALTAYSGAVILVSHDMHLLSMVADRLWLVKDGHVTPYEDDLAAYRKMLLTPEKATDKDKPKPVKSEKPSREAIMALRADARKGEERVKKINEMRDKLAKKLADPALYEDGKAGELATWNKKYAEVMDGLERAEAMWMAALEKLEKAQSL